MASSCESMPKLTIPSFFVVRPQLLRCSDSFSQIPAVWSLRKRPAFPHDPPSLPLRDRKYVHAPHWGGDIPYIQGHMHVRCPVGYLSQPLQIKHLMLIRFEGFDHDDSLLVVPFGYACTRWIRWSIAGCIAKDPPAPAPSACISHVSVAAMIRLPSRPVTRAAPARCASDGLPAQGPDKAQGRGAIRMEGWFRGLVVLFPMP